LKSTLARGVCANGPATLVAGLVAAACAGSAAAPAPAREKEAGAPPAPVYRLDAGEPESSHRSASPMFASLYRDIFSVEGVARCQHVGCHGGANGNAGLSMGTDAWGVYSALTSYTYDGRRLVAPMPDGDARSGSALLDVTSPSDGIMPRVEEEVGNRPLTAEEWGRLETWLASGGAF
jgi:hypothetical protein